MVIRVSGNQDPMKDERCHARDRIFAGQDRQGRSQRCRGRLFLPHRLKATQYTKLKAKIRNGVVETEQVEELHTPRIAWFYDHDRRCRLPQGQNLALMVGPDG